jgi:ribosomal protein S18 acetylase RimI-like enzyme
MNIRLLTAEDAAIFRAIRLAAVQDAPLAFAESFAEASAKSDEDFAHYLDAHSRGDFVLGAFNEGNLIGIVGFYRTNHAKHFHKGTIWGMYVKPDYRRRGVGAALIDAVIQRARTMPGVRQINLTVASATSAAKHLYESAGFRVYGTEPAALKFDGAHFDEDLMQLVL